MVYADCQVNGLIFFFTSIQKCNIVLYFQCQVILSLVATTIDKRPYLLKIYNICGKIIIVIMLLYVY